MPSITQHGGDQVGTVSHQANG